MKTRIVLTGILKDNDLLCYYYHNNKKRNISITTVLELFKKLMFCVGLYKKRLIAHTRFFDYS